MFENSLISLMLMLLLCFAGMLVMFLFIIKSLSTQIAVLREGFRRQEAAFADMERQVMEITFALRQRHPRNAAESTESPARDFSGDVMDNYPSAAGLGPFHASSAGAAFASEADRRSIRAPGNGSGKTFGKTRPGPLEILLET